MSVQAVILAAGQGRRVHPLGIHKPKSMYELVGKPLIQFAVENLRAAGIIDSIIVTGPHETEIHDHLGDGSSFGLRIQYVVQPEPLGQADAILAAEGRIRRHFVVLNANDILEPRLVTQLLSCAQTRGCDVGLVGRKVSDPWRFGVMRFDGGGRLLGVVEKPAKGEAPSDIAVVGVYFFSPEIFPCIRQISAGGADDQLERAYQILIDRGSATYLLYDGAFDSFKFPWNLLSMNDLLLERNIVHTEISPSAQISNRAVITGNVIIKDNVRVFENAVLRGPAYIGDSTVIGNNALLWGGCSLGRNCVVGYGSEIKHSVLACNVWTHMSYVGDSVLSDNCSLGAGTVTANFRFDEEEVSMNVDGARISTGVNKFGAIMAENCRTGCNSVLMPGVKVGPNSIIGPGVTLLEDLPPNRYAFLSRSQYQVSDNRTDLATKSRHQLMRKLEGKMPAT